MLEFTVDSLRLFFLFYGKKILGTGVIQWGIKKKIVKDKLLTLIIFPGENNEQNITHQRNTY